ncbi:11639_t:CDS:2 [Dentiscutata heterogama]|uniref:11639_t:CDS:1 n=1 Tax=Dentiscutata heterogama TaxID=1316150 RepID=A0ACA9LSW0_9GLOM|nr:11639_t:CDS:2 [Dentiscutata heterogama]
MHKVEQLVQDSVTESENEIDEIDEISSHQSYDLASHSFYESQEQPENSKELCLIKSGKVSWVWDHMKKDKSVGEVRCDVVILVNGNKKKCDSVFSITTSTTHLGEHLNTVHRIFHYQKYKKDLQGQKILESNQSIQIIPSMLAKMAIVEGQKFCQFCNEMDPLFKVPSSLLIRTKIEESLAIFTIDEFSYSHLRECLEQFLSKLFNHWNITDSLEDLEWLLLGDDDSESECDDLFKLLAWWNSTYFILKRLVQLGDPVKQLTKFLSRHPD